jgi:hypothetical protein
MKDTQIKAIKEDRDRSNGVYKGLDESAFSAAAVYQGRGPGCTMDDGTLPDLVLVLGPVVSCCLPVTGISAPPNLRWRAKASWKWQLLLLEVLHSAERWIVVR